MPLTDPYMLPPLVRTMAPMDDLLRAEESEIARLEAAVSHTAEQLLLSACDDAISRYERIYQMPVNTALPLADRRRRLITRANLREVSTPEYIRQVIEGLTGLTVDITEQYSKYTFCVLVHLSDKYALDLPTIRAKLNEIKPAHLAYIITSVAQTKLSVPGYTGVSMRTAQHYRIPVNLSGGDSHGNME